MNFDWDWRILAFIVCVSLLTSVVVGIIPALRVSSINPIDALKEGGRGASASRGTRTTLNLLVIGQIAMSVLLLLNAGLLIRSFLNLLHVDVGFDPRNVLTFRASFLSAISPSGINAVREGALAELAGLPGVRSIAMTSHIPLSGFSKRRALTAEGRTVLKLRDTPTVNLIWASPGFFNTLGIPMVGGRDFSWSDGSAYIAVIDASLANQYWPGQNPIGRRIRLGPPENNEPWHTVIGVVGDARINSLTVGQMGTVYIPISHVDWRSARFVVKSDNYPTSLASAVKQRLTSTAGETTVDQIQDLQMVKDIVVWQPRFFTTMLAAFAVIALVVTGVGLYGVMSYAVAHQTHDLGVRMALGASAAGIVGMIVRSAMFLTGVGIVIGTVGAVTTGKFIETQLFGVQTTDALTIATVCGVVTATAALASFLPALRAIQVDPVVTLRHD